MRITNQLMNFNNIYNYQKNSTSLYQSQQAFSSGLKIQHSYEGSAIYVDAARLEYEGNLLKQVETTTLKATEFSKNSDQALNDFVSKLTEFKTKLLQAANDIHDATSRNAIANDLEGIKQNLIDIANTTINGQYLFSGTALDTMPIDTLGNYHGNGETINANIGTSQTAKYNIDGESLFLGSDNDYNKVLTTNVSLHNLIKEAEENLDSVYIEVTDTIRDMIGLNYYGEVYREQNPNKDPAKDTAGYNTTFFMQGKDVNGNSFAKKFTLSPDASIKSLLDEIGYALGNDKNSKNKLVDVTLNNSGQIEVKDIKKGNNLLDFHIVGLTSQRNTETYKIGNTNLTITGTNKNHFRVKYENGELIIRSVNNPNTQYSIKANGNNGISVNNVNITGTNLVLDPAKLAQNGINQNDFDTFDVNNVIQYAQGGGRDKDGNWIFPDRFTSIEELDYNVKHGLAHMTEFIKSDYTRDSSEKNSATDYNRLRFEKDSNTLTGNVSQVVKSTSEYATDATRLSEVAGASFSENSTLDMNIVSANGTRYKASISFTQNQNNNNALEPTLTISRADNDFKAQQPAVFTSKIYTGVYDEAQNTTNPVVTKPEDITYRQLSDIISVVVSDNIPQNLPANATEKEQYEAFFVNAVKNASASVNVGLNYRGQLEIKDKSHSVTPIEISVFENVANGGEFAPGASSGSILSFNANSAITIDEINVDIFKDLDEMIQTVRDGSYRGNPDGNNARTSGIQGALKRIDHIQDHVNKLHTQIGSYTNVLESSGTRASMLYVNVESVKTDIVGADLGESMLIYKQYLLQFEAMLQTSAMIGKISLLNYM
ncbi:MAG: hypothetical protein SOW11_03240 [Campylobacter lanienae]|nr:hypothetical protein [Campylobacter lanienae]